MAGKNRHSRVSRLSSGREDAVPLQSLIEPLRGRIISELGGNLRVCRSLHQFLRFLFPALFLRNPTSSCHGLTAERRAHDDRRDA
jgi:hypothetical protein